MSGSKGKYPLETFRNIGVYQAPMGWMRCLTLRPCVELVASCFTLWWTATFCHGKIHHFVAGKIHYFDWAMFNCYLYVHQRVLTLLLTLYSVLQRRIPVIFRVFSQCEASPVSRRFFSNNFVPPTNRFCQRDLSAGTWSRALHLRQAPSRSRYSACLGSCQVIGLEGSTGMVQ